jgi:uncharacterized protein
MSKIPALVLVALLSASGSAQTPAETEAITRARTAVAHLQKGDYAAVAATFHEKMAAALPESKLRGMWDALRAQFGAMRGTGTPRAATKGELRVVLIPGEFEKATLDIQFAYDASGRCVGLNIRPASTPASDYKDAPYVTPARFSEREVTVDAGGWPLPATLTLPAGDGPFPAVVFVHGSGPNDRDESIGPNKPFRDLARGLASVGVAALRYEKRTRQFGQKIAPLTTFTVNEETVDDAVAAVRLLRGTRDIDPKRVFVLGHSLGGMVAPRIGRAAPTEIAGLIVMAGAARPLEDAMLAQVEYIAKADGTISPAEQQQIDEIRKLQAQVRALKPGDPPPSAAGIRAPASYWLDLRNYDPPAAAAGLSMPMLVLQGGRDYQVTADEYEQWRTALKARKNVTFRLYPALNHLFIAGTGASLPSEYLAPGHVAEEVVRDIAGWIHTTK